MHELSIVQALLDTALEHAERAHAHAICSLRVQVGALSGIDPESLAFAFDIASGGTPAKGAELHVQIVPPRARCQVCGAERELALGPGRTGEWYAQIQALGPCLCGSPAYELAGGLGCLLESIDVE